MNAWEIRQGDARDVLRSLDAESVHMCVTSPPYLAQRNYNVDGQVGLERTITDYVMAIVDIMREVRRVMRPDATLWLNLGDKYNGSGGAGGDYNDDGIREGQPTFGSFADATLPAKSLCMVPARVAIAMQVDGWLLRSEITWAKTSAMPQSVTDRPTSATERIYLFAKQGRYFYDRFGCAQPSNGWNGSRFGDGKSGAAKVYQRQTEHGEFHGGTPRPSDTKGGNQGKQAQVGSRQYAGFNDRWNASEANGSAPTTANSRDFWLLGPEPFAGEHFAVFPSEIPRRAILLGTSAHGCCAECGAPWARAVDKSTSGPTRVQDRPRYTRESEPLLHPKDVPTAVEYRTTGWAPTCAHLDAPTVPATVLDPFSGSGTSGVVAVKLGRRYVGIELNPDYVTMSERRIATEAAIGNTEETAATVGAAQLSLLAQ